MRSYEVRRHIAAEPAAVWAALTDGDRVVAAATGIQRIDGRIEIESTFTLWSEAVPDLQSSFDTFADGLARTTEHAR